ncbi:DMT family transporter [Baekduia soli]|uniref:DMT family transporter n=1 Tax=Baekduia soli TaxID=496014 RepID=A0A5B8U990_9ACTN|nr:DMT family transporter [Baekduia soli]QEC49600.1 DMT family transporter [Baekduia soli]
MSAKLPSFLPPLITVLLWGGMFPVAAGVMKHIDPVHVTAIRFGFAGLGFLVLLAAVEGRSALRYEGRFGVAFLYGSLGFAGFNILGYAGLRHTTPQHASLIVAIVPGLTVLGRWRLTRVRPSNRLLGFVVLAFAGVALVVVGDDPAAALHGGAGDLLVLFGATMWARYTLSSGQDYPGWSPLRITALTTAAATITILVVTVVGDVSGLLSLPSRADLSTTAGGLAYVVVLGAFVAMIGWNAGIARLGSANAALFMNLVPVTTFTIEAFRGATPTVIELIGAAITLAALVGANATMRAAAPAPAPAPAPTTAARSAAEAA